MTRDEALLLRAMGTGEWMSASTLRARVLRDHGVELDGRQVSLALRRLRADGLVKARSDRWSKKARMEWCVGPLQPADVTGN